VHSVQPSTTRYPPGTRVRIVVNMIHVVAFPLADDVGAGRPADVSRRRA
jgi:hypothetical protein